jgi:hypothetical protein
LGGRCDLTGWAPAAVDELLAGLPVSDVWGIGGRLTARLAPLGIRTTLDLARADPRQMRRLFSVVVERTVRELGGVPCLEFGPAPPVRRELMHGRMLGQLGGHVRGHLGVRADRRAAPAPAPAPGRQCHRRHVDQPVSVRSGS